MSTDIKIRTPTGLLGGAAINTITYTPAFFKVTPSSGASTGGTLLTVTGTGFGVNTSGLNLRNWTVSTTSNICSEVKVIAYGTFTCLTTKGAVAATNDIRMLKGTSAYTCSNPTTTNCKFSTSAATTPTVTSASVIDNVITFSGSNFPAEADYTAKAVFKSAYADVLSWTTTSLTATFPTGVPAAVATENAVPRILFMRKSDSVVFLSDSTNVYLTNALTASPADSTAGL